MLKLDQALEAIHREIVNFVATNKLSQEEIALLRTKMKCELDAMFITLEMEAMLKDIFK